MIFPQTLYMRNFSISMVCIKIYEHSLCMKIIWFTISGKTEHGFGRTKNLKESYFGHSIGAVNNLGKNFLLRKMSFHFFHVWWTQALASRWAGCRHRWDISFTATAINLCPVWIGSKVAARLGHTRPTLRSWRRHMSGAPEDKLRARGEQPRKKRGVQRGG